MIACRIVCPAFPPSNEELSPGTLYLPSRPYLPKHNKPLPVARAVHAAEPRSGSRTSNRHLIPLLNRKTSIGNA